eukprot:s896_g22.t1
MPSNENPADEPSRRFEPAVSGEGSELQSAEPIVDISQLGCWPSEQWFFIHFCSGPRRAGDLLDNIEILGREHGIDIQGVAIDPLAEVFLLNSLKPPTIRKYTAALEELNSELLAHDHVWADMSEDEQDLFVSEWLIDGFESGAGRAEYGWALSALQKVFPRLRLKTAWRVYDVWGQHQPPKQAPAATPEFLQAMMAMALFLGKPQVAAVMVLCYAGLLRVREALSLKGRDVIVQADSITLCLGQTKRGVEQKASGLKFSEVPPPPPEAPEAEAIRKGLWPEAPEPPPARGDIPELGPKPVPPKRGMPRPPPPVGGFSASNWRPGNKVLEAESAAPTSSSRARTAVDMNEDVQVVLARARGALLRRPRAKGNWVQAFARHDTTGLGELSVEQFALFLQSLSVGLSLREVMLAADKLLLTSTIRKNATELKGKELALHKGNFDAVGTQAAVLAGFAVVMVVEFHMPEEAHFALQGVYYIFAVITLVANLRCVAMTTCITVMGTGLALRGPDGSMVRAVEGMYKQRAIVFRSFGTGIVSCCLSVAVIAWIKMLGGNRMDIIPAAICTGAIAWTLFSIAKYTNFYLDFFKFNEDEVVSLDDILGADLVNKEAIVKQLGVGSDTLVDAIVTCLLGDRSTISLFVFGEAIEHASPRYEFEMWQLATHLTGGSSDGLSAFTGCSLAEAMAGMPGAADQAQRLLLWLPKLAVMAESKASLRLTFATDEDFNEPLDEPRQNQQLSQHLCMA